MAKFCPQCGGELTLENRAFVDYSGGKQDGGAEMWCAGCLREDLGLGGEGA